MERPPQRVLLRVCLPKWFQILCAIAALINVPLFLFISFAYAHEGFIFPKILVSAFTLAIVVGAIWIIPLSYTTVYVTEFGVTSDRPFGLKQKRFRWDEILTVSRPRFGIPYDLAYVISKTGEKISVLRGATGYPELLEIIESKVPNLTPKSLAPGLWPKTSSWKGVLIVMGLFIAYVLVRSLLKF